MLTSIKGTLASQLHLIGELARVIAVLSQADSLHDTPAIRRHFIKLYIPLLNTPRLKALK